MIRLFFFQKFFSQKHLLVALRSFGTRVLCWLLISSILASDLAYAMQKPGLGQHADDASGVVVPPSVPVRRQDAAASAAVPPLPDSSTSSSSRRFLHDTAEEGTSLGMRSPSGVAVAGAAVSGSESVPVVAMLAAKLEDAARPADAAQQTDVAKPRGSSDETTPERKPSPPGSGSGSSTPPGENPLAQRTSSGTPTPPGGSSGNESSTSHPVGVPATAQPLPTASATAQSLVEVARAASLASAPPPVPLTPAAGLATGVSQGDKKVPTPQRAPLDPHRPSAAPANENTSSP